MKKILLFTVLSFLYVSINAQISFKTGNNQLDANLNQINVDAKLDIKAFHSNLSVSYNVTQKKLDYMSTSLHMEPAEIYFALEVSKVSKKPLDDVIKVYSADKERGWGYIAKQVGVKPGSPEFHQLKNNSGKQKAKGNGKNKGNSKSKGNGNGHGKKKRQPNV